MTRPRLDVAVGGRVAIALVDLAVVRGGWIGAHAIWDPDLLVEAIVARGDPTVPGLAGVAGTVHPLDERDGLALHVRFGRSGRAIVAPLGPGQLVPIRVTGWRTFGPGETIVTPDRRDRRRPGRSRWRSTASGRSRSTAARSRRSGSSSTVRACWMRPALLRRAATEGRLVGTDAARAG